MEYIGTERRKDYITRHAIDLIGREPNRALDLFRAAFQMDEAEMLATIPSAPIAKPVLTIRTALCIGIVSLAIPFLFVWDWFHGPVMPRKFQTRDN